jgi:hypothetical protein
MPGVSAAAKAEGAAETADARAASAEDRSTATGKCKEDSGFEVRETIESDESPP